MSDLLSTLVVPGYEGRAVALERGQRLRVTDAEGTQIADLSAIDRNEPDRYLDTARTRVVCQKLFPCGW